MGDTEGGFVRILLWVGDGRTLGNEEGLIDGTAEGGLVGRMLGTADGLQLGVIFGIAEGNTPGDTDGGFVEILLGT